MVAELQQSNSGLPGKPNIACETSTHPKIEIACMPISAPVLHE